MADPVVERLLGAIRGIRGVEEETDPIKRAVRERIRRGGGPSLAGMPSAPPGTPVMGASQQELPEGGPVVAPGARARQQEAMIQDITSGPTGAQYAFQAIPTALREANLRQEGSVTTGSDPDEGTGGGGRSERVPGDAYEEWRNTPLQSTYGQYLREKGVSGLLSRIGGVGLELVEPGPSELAPLGAAILRVPKRFKIGQLLDDLKFGEGTGQFGPGTAEEFREAVQRYFDTFVPLNPSETTDAMQKARARGQYLIKRNIAAQASQAGALPNQTARMLNFGKEWEDANALTHDTFNQRFFEDAFRTLNEPAQEGLELYTSYDYAQLNDWLRNPNSPSLPGDVADLDDAKRGLDELLSHPDTRLPEDLTLYRGQLLEPPRVSNDPNKLVGTIMSDPAYQSFTESLPMAYDFMRTKSFQKMPKGGMLALTQVDVPAGTRALPLSEATGKPLNAEAEVLFPRETGFRVRNVEERTSFPANQPYLVIDVEPVEVP